MNSDLKRLLYALNDKYGETHTSRTHKTEYVAIHKTKRKEVIWYLVNTLKSRGRDQDYFETSSFQTDLTNFFFPDGSTEGLTRQKREGARVVVLRELNEVLAKVWPEEDLFAELPEFDAPSAKETPTYAVIESVPGLRPDAKANPYEMQESVIDEEFMNALREIANE